MGKWWEYDPGRPLPAGHQDSDRGEATMLVKIVGSAALFIAAVTFLILVLLRIVA